MAGAVDTNVVAADARMRRIGVPKVLKRPRASDAGRRMEVDEVVREYYILAEVAGWDCPVPL